MQAIRIRTRHVAISREESVYLGCTLTTTTTRNGWNGPSRWDVWRWRAMCGDNGQGIGMEGFIVVVGVSCVYNGLFCDSRLRDSNATGSINHLEALTLAVSHRSVSMSMRPPWPPFVPGHGTDDSCDPLSQEVRCLQGDPHSAWSG